MSRQLINDYFNEIDRLRKFSGTTTESVLICGVKLESVEATTTAKRDSEDGGKVDV